MKYFWHHGIFALMVYLVFSSPALLAAQEARPVYLIKQQDQNDVWTMNMGIQAEALRLFVPTVFERKGKAVNLSMDTPRVSISSGRETVVTRTREGILVRYEVVVEGAAGLPKPDHTVIIRFALTELQASEAADAGTPASYAVRQAILTGPYSRGRAWVQSIDFKENRFIVVVGLKH